MITPTGADRLRRPSPVGNRKIFWASVVIGWALIAIGIRGVIVDAIFTRPPQWSVWFVGAALFHDFIVAPVVFAIAVVVLRRVRRPYRAPVQAALALTALVTVGTLPVLLRLGEPIGNPTVLPTHDAGPALAILLGAIWAATAVFLVTARRRLGTGRRHHAASK